MGLRIFGVLFGDVEIIKRRILRNMVVSQRGLQAGVFMVPSNYQDL
jgi:hypothetical protein